MKSHHYVLVILLYISLVQLVVFLGNGIYVYPAKWDVSSVWGINYLIANGKIYGGGLNYPTWQSSLVQYAQEDVLGKMLPALLSLITGVSTFPNNVWLYRSISISGLLIIPLTCLMLYKFLAKKLNNFNNIDALFIFLISATPMSGALFMLEYGLQAPNNISKIFFIFILVMLLMVFQENNVNSRKIIPLLIMIYPAYLFHHTWSYYLAIYFLSLTFLTLNNKSERYISGLCLLGMISYFASAIYVNTKILHEPFYFLSQISHVFDIFSWAHPYFLPVNEEMIGYSIFGSLYNYLQYIDIILMGLFIIYFLFDYIFIRDKELYPIRKMLLYFLLLQVVVGLCLFVTSGFIGVATRSFESFIYIILFILCYDLSSAGARDYGQCRNKYWARLRKPHISKLALRSLIISILIITNVSYQIYPPEWKSKSLFNEEYFGIEFIGNHINETSFIFSDFRLGMPLILFGQFGIVTIDSPNQDRDDIAKILNSCYYNVSHPEMILDAIMPSLEYFIFASEFQSEIGLLDPTDFTFKPASQGFQEDLSREIYLNKLYSSGFTTLFYRY